MNVLGRAKNNIFANWRIATLSIVLILILISVIVFLFYGTLFTKDKILGSICSKAEIKNLSIQQIKDNQSIETELVELHDKVMQRDNWQQDLHCVYVDTAFKVVRGNHAEAQQSFTDMQNLIEAGQSTADLPAKVEQITDEIEKIKNNSTNSDQSQDDFLDDDYMWIEMERGPYESAQ